MLILCPKVSDVEICCYSLVHWDDPKAKGGNSDSPYREGHLLYKIHEAGASLGSTLRNTVYDPTTLIYGVAWKPAYVVLRLVLKKCIFIIKLIKPTGARLPQTASVTHSGLLALP